MPTLNIAHPTNNEVVPVRKAFPVSGEASDAGMPEPHSIDSVTVQVDGGPVIDAILTAIPNKERTLVAFKAFTQVPGGPDPHVVRVTATNELGVSVKSSVHVLTEPLPFAVVAPALQLEISPAPIDPGNPANKTMVDTLVGKIQTQLAPMSTLLASIRKTLAGPNLVLATGPSGSQVLRIGLWIVGSDFPLVAARPPQFPLPVLSDQAAFAGFSTVPLLPLPGTSGLQLFAYGLFIPTTTLQQIVDAMFPGLAAAVAKKSISLESVTVACTAPSSVSTSFVGHLGFPPATITGTITEVLGTTAVAGAQPPQSIPAITASSHSSGSNVLDEVLLGLISPMFLIFLLEGLIIAIGTPIGVGELAGKAAGIAASIVAGIPKTVPFRNTITSLLPAFPMIVPNWTRFGTTNSGMRSSGTITIPPRDQTMVSLRGAGPTRIIGYQADLAGGADETYDLAWANLVPDRDKFTWQVSGTGTDEGPIDLTPWSQRGRLFATFPLPLNVQPGPYPFTLAADATETSGVDSTKKLTASWATDVTVDVRRNPKVKP